MQTLSVLGAHHDLQFNTHVEGAYPDFQLNTEEGATLLRILSASLRVRRHYELFLWLSGELQRFLPHSVLISAWGNFASGSVMLDVVSGLPGVRTERLKDCRIDDLVMHCYGEWVGGERRPVLVTAGGKLAPEARCGCSIHGALRGLRSLLVHGFRDERSGQESLYIYFNAASFTRGRCKQEFLAMVDLLLGPVDAAFRRVAVLPAEDRGPAPDNAPFDLSPREHEVVICLCRGQSNATIAQTLGISLFTVKNHLQRIFEKSGAASRTEVVAAYNRARSPSGNSLLEPAAGDPACLSSF